MNESDVPSRMAAGQAAMQNAAKRFGQSAVATPANAVTLTRILIALPGLYYMYQRGSGWLTVALWFTVTTSDSLDGWLARRDGATRSGAFLDPVADKLIVLGGMSVLAARGEMWWWPVVLIAVREFGISAYRSVAGRRGIVMPAQRLGKYKAGMQFAAVGWILLPWTETFLWFQRFNLMVAVMLTIVSGIQILQHGYTDWQRN